MAVRLGDTAPNFKVQTTQGEIEFHEWMGNDWAVLFSHPKDYTPVCTTELGAVARLKPEFDRRGVKVIGLSVDGVRDHHGWSKDIADTQGTELNFPLIADPDRIVSGLYDMIHPKADDTFTVRSVFVIDSDKKVRLTITYPASTGRNFDEILRVIDSLKLTSDHQVATPVNWRQKFTVWRDKVEQIPMVADLLDQVDPFSRRENRNFGAMTLFAATEPAREFSEGSTQMAGLITNGDVNVLLNSAEFARQIQRKERVGLVLNKEALEIASDPELKNRLKNLKIDRHVDEFITWLKTNKTPNF